ncbi:MAG: hypothetical protein ACI8ZM_002043 [Crocinitomix sp.]|jgi:hypothetical protein
MRTSFALILVTGLLLFTNCRKDPALIELDPLGNTLVLQLDVNYEIEAAAETTLGTNFVDQVLNLELQSESSEIDVSSQVLVFKESGDTALYFYDKHLISPNLLPNERMAITDDRLYTKISTADFVSLADSKYNSELMLKKVGNSNLLHGYFNSETGNRIAVFSFIVYVLNEEVGFSFPTRQYFLIAAK